MDTKEALKQRITSQYQEWKADFDKLKAETKGAYAEGQLEGSKEANELESKMDEVKAFLAKLENENEEDLEKLKNEAESQLEGFKNSFQNLKNKLN
jgi:flagellar biosynthesis/type III secretory pathway protein FliH